MAIEHVESASTLVRRHERTVQLTLPMAMEIVSQRRALPAAVADLLPAPSGAGQRKAALVASRSRLRRQGPDAARLEQLDKARGILNEMYSSEQAQLDVIIWDCRSFINTQTALMNENARLRANEGANLARAKGRGLEGAGQIKGAKKELDELKIEKAKHGGSCLETLGAGRAQEAILVSDYEVAKMIGHSMEESCDAKAEKALLQDEQGLPRTSLQLSETSFQECQNGTQTYFEFGGAFGHVQSQFRSPVAHAALQRMAKLALGSHPQSPVLALARKSTRAHTEPGAKEADAKADMEGELAKRPKCAVSQNPNCPALEDAIGGMIGDVLGQLQQVRMHLTETDKSCKQVADNYDQQIIQWRTALENAQTSLAKGVQEENAATQAMSNAMREFEHLDSELAAKQTSCDERKTESTNQLCGIKKIRLEMYQMDGLSPLIQDCEVGDWVDRECSVTCGGGTQEVGREVISEGQDGAGCPPLEMQKPCQEQACPVDCILGTWAPWGGCSKDCGGGVYTRIRDVHEEQQHGGDACDETSETQGCNTGSCDVDCELKDWSDWSPCSKACGFGVVTRTKEVDWPAQGFGECSGEDSPARFEELACNEMACPPNLVCDAKMDLVLLLDGSGSVQPTGFAETKGFAHDLLSRIEYGEDKGKVGVLKFSKEVEILSPMSDVEPDLLSAVDGDTFHGKTTDTGKALSMSLNILSNGGRKDAASVVFVVTDGMPVDAQATATMARKVKDGGARLVFMAIGPNVDEEQLLSWASFPAEQNVLHAKDYATLREYLGTFLADLCPALKCRETFDQPDMSDYIGCQAKTVDGHGCQAWTEQFPVEHPYTPRATGAWPAHLEDTGIQGGHNYCRNPDKNPKGAWCYLAAPLQLPATEEGGEPVEETWGYCQPRSVNATGW